MAWLALVACGVLGAAASGQVYVRDRAAPLAGAIASMDAGGVTLTGDDGAAVVVGWPRVRSVEGPRGAEAAAYLATGDSIRRGAARLDRGDLVLAARVLEPVYAAGPLRGPTGGALGREVVRLRLLSRRPVTATLPWLEWASLDAASRTGRADARRTDTLMDEGTGLCPRLAPIFSGLQAPVSLGAMLSAPEWSRWGAAARPMADWYRAAAQFEVAGGAEALVVEPLPAEATEAQALVHAIVRARVGTPEVREAGRAELSRRLREVERGSGESEAGAAWMEAWLRAGLGRSLLREDDAASRRLGVIQLLHVPARFADTLPELSALALGDAAAALRGLGEHAAASVIEADLRGLGGSAGAAAEELDPAESSGGTP